MSNLSEVFGAAKVESTLLVLFIPSVDRDSLPIDREMWVQAALVLLGRLFGGATAMPAGRGVWRDDSAGGSLVFDSPVLIHCYTSDSEIDRHASELHLFLRRLGKETNQGAVGFVIDRHYLEIRLDSE